MFVFHTSSPADVFGDAVMRAYGEVLEDELSEDLADEKEGGDEEEEEGDGEDDVGGDEDDLVRDDDDVVVGEDDVGVSGTFENKTNNDIIKGCFFFFHTQNLTSLFSW